MGPHAPACWRSPRQRDNRTFVAELIAIFPVSVEGSNQGVAVQVGGGTRVLRDE